MLTDLQRVILAFVTSQTSEAKLAFQKGKNVRDQISIAGAYAYALYVHVTTTGGEIRFSSTLQSNTGTNPTDPEFFQNLHVLEDFVRIAHKL